MLTAQNACLANKNASCLNAPRYKQQCDEAAKLKFWQFWQFWQFPYPGPIGTFSPPFNHLFDAWSRIKLEEPKASSYGFWLIAEHKKERPTAGAHMVWQFNDQAESYRVCTSYAA